MSKKLTNNDFIHRSKLKHGDKYDGNPNKYNKNDINPVNNIKFGKLYRETIKRESHLKSCGYNLVTIWESDYKKIYK